MEIDTDQFDVQMEIKTEKFDFETDSVQTSEGSIAALPVEASVEADPPKEKIKKTSKYPELYSEIYKCYTAKDYNKCLDYIHAVKEQYIEYQILKSACLIHLGGKILEAHAILDEILVKEPNNAYTIYAKGLALFHEEKYEEAITYFTQARKLDQTSDMIRAEIMTEKAHAKIKERQEKSSRPKAVPSRFKIAAPVKPPVVFRTPTTNNKPVYSPPSSDKTDRRFGCEICNHFFAKKFNLDRHNRSLHKRTTPDNFPTSPRDIKLKSKSSLVPRIKAEPVFKKEPVVKSAIKPEPKQAAAIVVEPKSATKAVSKKTTSPVKSALKKFPSKIDVSLLPVKNGKVKCPECRRFFRKTSISRHILIHTGNKGHKCDQCTMAFYQKSDLSRHVATHSEVMNFSCDMCDRKFRIKKNLQVHKKRHHSSHL